MALWPSRVGPIAVALRELAPRTSRTVSSDRHPTTFGGSQGGPVAIPTLYNGHNKTFFFLDYEGNRKRTSQPEQFLVPTAAERAGNLNDLVSSNSP